MKTTPSLIKLLSVAAILIMPFSVSAATLEIDTGEDYGPTLGDKNLVLIWEGKNNGTWESSYPRSRYGNWSRKGNWFAYQKAGTFLDGDAVIFGGTSPHSAVTITNSVTVSDMKISSGEFIFSGEKITGTMSINSSDITPTGKLTISGDDTKTMFFNDIDFEHGAEVLGKATAAFSNLTGPLYNEGAANAKSITGEVINKGVLILAAYKLDANGNPTGITTGSGNTITQGNDGRLSITTSGGSCYETTLNSSVVNVSKTGSSGTLMMSGGALSTNATTSILSGNVSLTLSSGTLTLTGTDCELSGATISGSLLNQQILVSNQGTLRITNPLNITNVSGPGTIIVEATASGKTLDNLLANCGDNLTPISAELRFENTDGTYTIVAPGSTYDGATNTFTQPDGITVTIDRSNSASASTNSLLRNATLLSATAPDKGILGDVANDGVIITQSIEGKVSNNHTLIADMVTGELTTGSRSTTSITDQFGDVTNAGLFNVTHIEGNVINQRSGTLKLVGDDSDFLIAGNVENNGHLDFLNAGRILTITGDLTSTAGGTYTMDVDPSGQTPSDKMVVGGNIIGTHRFNLRFSGNPNTITRESVMGIVIDAPNNIVGDENITGRVNAGLYQFSLTPSSTNPGSYEFVATGYSPTSQTIINTTGAIATGWFSQLDNLLKRMGDIRLSGGALSNGDLWLRAYGQQTNNDLGLQGMSDFKEYQYGADIGADWVLAFDPVNTFVGGAFVGYQGATRRFHDGLGSKGESDSVYGGLYATWLHADGWYADGVVKAQRFHNSYDVDTDQGVFDNYGLGASIEFGKQFSFGDGWFAEPSVQFAYTHIFAESYSTRDSLRVTNGDSDIYRFAGNIRAGKTIGVGEDMLLQPYVKIGIEEQISSGGSVRIATERFEPNTDGTRGIVGVGVIWQLDSMQQIHFDYEASWGDKYDKPWGVNAGYRLRF
ncbi:MAG: autotransporter outer membrane beta-barrel domain-containing protein [Puniceicoccales bacterium]|jgi:outer membrane autotransporter protein|nr:autotransporter outer membrane beta-barrel domain-containing protein [Puniceicoccales bacterium]